MRGCLFPCVVNHTSRRVARGSAFAHPVAHRRVRLGSKSVDRHSRPPSRLPPESVPVVVRIRPYLTRSTLPPSSLSRSLPLTVIMSAVRPPASALSHKRTLSSLNRPSPAGQSPLASCASPAAAGGTGSVAADSPERSSKRARFDAPAAKASPAASVTVPSPSPGQGPSRNGHLAEEQKPPAGKSTLSKGAEWVIKQVEVMEAQYKVRAVAHRLVESS